MIPAFSPKIVENFVDIFAEQSEKLVSLLDAKDGAGKFSLWPYVSAYTLDSVCGKKFTYFDHYYVQSRIK